MCEYCDGTEAFVDEKTGITLYIAYDNTLEIDSDGGTSFWNINNCPMCGRNLRKEGADE